MPTCARDPLLVPKDTSYLWNFNIHLQRDKDLNIKPNMVKSPRTEMPIQ